MSYDVVISAHPVPPIDATAWLLLDALIEQQGEAPPQFRQLYDRLVQRFPCLSTLSDDLVDDGAWSSAPLWNDFGPAAALLAISSRRVDEVLPFVVETARSIGLPVFDSTTGLIHRPEGIADLELAVEERFPHRAPTLQQILDAARSLTPNGGPGFLCLDRPGSGYLQAAGGVGAYICECREYKGATFKHWAIGLAGPAGGDIQIPTNGFHVTAKSNERLSLPNVEGLLTAFVNGGETPAAFTRRDITSRFA